jgi:hypothetical protein
MAITVWPGFQLHAAHAARGAAQRAHFVFVEAHGLAAVAEQHHVVLAVGQRGADQVVALVQVDGDDAGLARVAEFVQRRLLHRAQRVDMKTKWSAGKLRNSPVSGSTTVIFSPCCSGNMLTMGLPRLNCASPAALPRP